MSVGVPDGRDRQRDIDPCAVFSDAHGLEVLDAFATLQARENLRDLVGAVGGRKHNHRSSPRPRSS